MYVFVNSDEKEVTSSENVVAKIVNFPVFSPMAGLEPNNSNDHKDDEYRDSLQFHPSDFLQSYP